MVHVCSIMQVALEKSTSYNFMYLGAVPISFPGRKPVGYSSKVLCFPSGRLGTLANALCLNLFNDIRCYPPASLCGMRVSSV